MLLGSMFTALMLIKGNELKRLQPATQWLSDKRGAGFTLIELLVGVLLGMLVIVGVMQIYRVWDGRQRAIMSTNDAQTTGAIAGLALDRDLRSAAHGFGTAYQVAWGGGAAASDKTLGCDVKLNNVLFPSVTSFKLLPIRIINGTNGAPDTVFILGGNSSFMVKGTPIIDNTDTDAHVISAAGINPGDRVVFADKALGNCKIVEVSRTDDYQIFVDGSAYTRSGISVTPKLKNPNGVAGLVYSDIYNLGPDASYIRYEVDSSALTLDKQDILSSGIPVVFPVAEGVINFQAQYGVGGNGLDVVWKDDLPTSTPFSSVVAVRFGLLLRSRQFVQTTSDGKKVTEENPKWAGGEFVMPSAAASDWQNYRYRVYEGVISLRNVVWGGVNG